MPSAASPAPEEPYQEPADHDSWYSALVSFVFHFCLVMLLPLFAAILESKERLPPAVDMVQVLDTSGADADPAAGLPGAEAAAESTHSDRIAGPDAGRTRRRGDHRGPAGRRSAGQSQHGRRQAGVGEPEKRRGSSSRSRPGRSQGAREKLNQNLGGKPGGGGGGGGGGTGRAGRAARWVLKFNYSNANHYLSQLGGLGAAIAFPQRGDQWLYFTDLAGSPSRSVRDLSGEDRIFWINEDPASAGVVAQSLGIGPVTPMLAFLPVELEQRMLKMELAYKGAASEDDIIQTVFECVARGGGFDVIVVDQKP